MKVTALDHLVLTVSDIDAATQFYTSVLGMTVEVVHPADGTVRTALKFGGQKINLHPKGSAFEPRAAHPAPGTADLCFLTDMPLARWQDHLRQQKIDIELGPVPRTGATGPIQSIYIRDPDCNLIEISVLV